MFAFLACTATRDTSEWLAAELRRKLVQIVRFPRSGRPREDLASGLRSIPVSRFVVFYRVRDQAVEVVRILHSARDVTSVL